MINNQINITERILKNEATRSHFIFNFILYEDKDIWIENASLQLGRIRLYEFQNYSNENDEGVLYDYFLSCVKLLGDLCYSRNMLAIDELQLIYDFDLLKSIITSDIKISYDIKEAFTYLFTHLWTDVPPFSCIDMDFDVIPYQELSSFIKLNTSKIECSAFDDIKNFIFSFVNDMVLRIIYDKNNREIILRFLKSLLILCENLFRLGFYKNLEDYNN